MSSDKITWYFLNIPLYENIHDKIHHLYKNTLACLYKIFSTLCSFSKLQVSAILFGYTNLYIYICQYVYWCSEKIVIPREKQKIVMQGNDASKVIIQYNDAGLSNSSGPFIVNAEYFVAIKITFKVRVHICSYYWCLPLDINHVIYDILYIFRNNHFESSSLFSNQTSTIISYKYNW